MEDKEHVHHVNQQLQTYLVDNTQAWALGPDGNYTRVAAGDAPSISAQETLLRRYADAYD